MSDRIRKDLDINNRASWQGVLEMLTALCGGAADLSYAYRDTGGFKLPVIEIRLDRPEEMDLPSVIEGEVRRDYWDRGTVLTAETLPDLSAEDGDVWALRENGTAVVAYHAFIEAIRVFRELDLDTQFVWSQIPLAPACDDVRITKSRERVMFSLGAVHTVWVREDSDERIKEKIREMKDCGELRVQNMATANTWIAGRTDEKAVLGFLQR